MPDQKLDNLLNLAMDATPQERAKSENLNVGYDSTTRLWDVIVKYSEPERGLGGDGIQVVPLLGGYAVVTLPETELDAYSDREQVEFIEKPVRLYFEDLFSSGFPERGRQQSDSAIMGSECEWKSTRKLCDRNRIYKRRNR